MNPEEMSISEINAQIDKLKSAQNAKKKEILASLYRELVERLKAESITWDELVEHRKRVQQQELNEMSFGHLRRSR